MAKEPLHVRVARVEALATRNPAAYRRKLRTFVFAGVLIYLALALLAVAMCALPLLTWHDRGGRVPVYVLFVGAVALYALLAALFVRGDERPEPSYAVSRTDAPGLWRRIDELCAALGTSPVEEAALDLEFNASVARRSRFLLWGRGKTELRLGLPLVLMSDPDELSAILAHELGHHRAGDAHESVRTVRVALALQAVAHRIAGNGGIAAMAILPIAGWYVPALYLLVLPLEREAERAADAAEVAVGLGAAGARAMARMEVLGTWYARGFLSHRPSFPSLVEGMSRTLPHDLVVRKLESAIVERNAPDDAHPDFVERIALLGSPLTRENGEIDPAAVARLASEAAAPSPVRAWDTFFEESFRERIAQEADRSLVRDARPAAPSNAPPTRLEEARRMAAVGDDHAAAEAFRAVANDPASGPIARLEATRLLIAEAPFSSEAAVARERMIEDPFVGVDALLEHAYLARRQYHAGEGGMTRERTEEIARKAREAHGARRDLVVWLHGKPEALALEPASFPYDLVRELVKGLVRLPAARRAWTFWAPHPRNVGLRVPILVIDVGAEAKTFKLTREDPKKLAEATELGFEGPAGIAVFVGRSPTELASIVRDRAPFWNAPPVGPPNEKRRR